MVPEESVHPDGGAEGYPLSPLQQGMLFHSLQATSPGVDLEQCICELREEIDVARFAQAWREVVSRHAILRTKFVWENGEPRQVVQSASHARLRIHHAEFGSETEARHGLEAYLGDDRREGFDVREAPLLRVALLSAGPKHHWWVATFHHLLLDGRALVLMFKEVHEIHDALVQGWSLQLPSPRPYRNYIDWLQTLDEARAEKFWRQNLQGLTAPTILPGQRPAAMPADDVEARGELAYRFSRETTARLRAATERHGITMNTLMQAAWSIVLSRHTGEEDVVFGAVRACRHIPVEGAGSIIGLFINTVPLRVRVPADATIGGWLRVLREQWVTLRAYEHTPLMKAQQWSEVAPGRPLFETLLNYQDPSWDTALRELGGKWTGREFDIRSQPNYPLAVDACGGAAVMVKMLYDRRRFADEMIVRLMGHYRVTLEALAGDAERVGDLPLLTGYESREILGSWQGAVADYPRETCAHLLFEQHALRTPGRIALADTTTTLTYGELNERANQLARRLAQHGVGRETLVAVCMARSCEMIVAWLAALKAGGAFVPLDPGYPPERIGFMLEDSRAPVLVTQRSVAAKLEGHSAVVICLDQEVERVAPNALQGERTADSGRGPTRSTATPDHLAYVIYTSGSTGQPKGVQIEHRALMNLVSWHQSAFEVTANDRATQIASPAFDASVWEIWPYLTAGASVHIPDEETRISPAPLWRWMAEQKITIGFLPTPLAEAAMNEPWPRELSLRLLLTGGDKLHRPPPSNFPCELVNNYGPTENAVVATAGLVARGGEETFAPTIGRPITNTRCYILDTRLRPVPAGVPGELYIGGASLARGYHQRPELTAGRFVKLQLPDGSTERVYRTGDRVRWTRVGEIEFLGRLDGQVKIRGCRIEPGEIEAALRGHPAVRECVVLTRADDRGLPQLVAYVLLTTPAPSTESNLMGYSPVAPFSGESQGAGWTESNPIGYFQVETELVEFLRAKLPGHMVPAAIMRMDAWPLTPNGKIDRAALPAPVARPTDGNAPFAAPSSATEKTVARIWTEILGRAQIGRHDNFFDLGGHSLLAAQVISRLNHALQSALTVRAVFDQPTVAGLAREVETRQAQGGTPRVPTQRVKRRASRTEVEALQTN